MNRIFGLSFAPYALWPGSQLVQRDILKYDSAARNGVSTIVVEEMEWVDLQHRKTLESTLNSIKEHLSGDGLDVRLSKNMKNKIEGLKFKMDYCLISMNPSNIVNYEVLNTRINSKEEWKRRFYVIDMENVAMQSLYQSDKHWERSFYQIAARIIQDDANYNKFKEVVESEELLHLLEPTQTYPDVIEPFPDHINPTTECQERCSLTISELNLYSQADYGPVKRNQPWDSDEEDIEGPEEAKISKQLKL